MAITPRSFRETDGEHLDLLRQGPLDARFPPQDRPLSEGEMIELVRGCPALIVGIDPVTESVMRAGPLRLVVKYGSGLDNIDLEAAQRLGVGVKNTPAANARSVAELTIGLALALARHIPLQDRLARTGSWIRRTGIELFGRCWGVVGYGAVGRCVATLAQGLGMKVMAHDPYVARAEVELVPLEDLLRASDVVSLHVPLNDSTRHLIDERALSLMRPGALLVNTARGGIVDEAALAEALESGRVGGAAVDDLERNPPVGSPLLVSDRFIASPHAGAATREAVERAGVMAVRLVLEALERGSLAAPAS